MCIKKVPPFYDKLNTVWACECQLLIDCECECMWLAQDNMGTGAAWKWDCRATESTQWYASLSLSRTWTCPPPVCWKWQIEGFLWASLLADFLINYYSLYSKAKYYVIITAQCAARWHLGDVVMCNITFLSDFCRIRCMTHCMSPLRCI